MYQSSIDVTLDILSARCNLDVDGIFFGQIFGDAIVVVIFVRVIVVVIFDVVVVVDVNVDVVAVVVVVIDDVDVMSAIMSIDPLTSICSL